MHYSFKELIKPLLIFGFIIGLINNIAIVLLNNGYILLSSLLFLNAILIFIYIFINFEIKILNNYKSDLIK